MREQDSKASPLWIWFGTVMFGLLGLLMLTQGLGLHDASWFNPNPNVPSWVFSIVGLILLLAVPLMLAQLRSINKRIVNLTGFALLVLMFIFAHWLVFLAEGGSCSFEGITLALGLPDLICTGVFGAVLVACDLLLVAFAVGRIRSARKQRQVSVVRFELSQIGAAAIAMLKREFPDQNFQYNTESNPIAFVEGPKEGLGDVKIHDDGVEITAHYGYVTHQHFDPQLHDFQPQEKRQQLALNELREYLHDTFDDKVYFHDMWWGGAVGRRGVTTRVGNRQIWLWSRKLQPDEFY